MPEGLSGILVCLFLAGCLHTDDAAFQNIPSTERVGSRDIGASDVEMEEHCHKRVSNGFLADIGYPETERIPVTDTLYDVTLTDEFRWLEDGMDPAVQDWTKQQIAYTRQHLDRLPAQQSLQKRFRELFFYDDSTPPSPVHTGDRTFWWEKKKDDEHWTYHTRANDHAEAVMLLNPNEWGDSQTLDLIAPSQDGRYLAFGIARGGNENPVIQILDVETRQILPDTCTGWKHQRVSWLPDNSGFYFSANPLKGDVPEGEEHFWHTAWFHTLGTTAENDKQVFGHDTFREAFHQVIVSEDGSLLFYYRMYRANTEIFFKPLTDPGEPVPIVTGQDAYSTVQNIGDTLFLWTTVDAPMGTVMTTDLRHPERDQWKIFLQETDDSLQYISLSAGKVFAVYLHDVHTLIRIYSPEGERLRELELPGGISSAGVSGYWHHPRARVYVTSFNRPSTMYEYDYDANTLIPVHISPIQIDSDAYQVNQVFYPSFDGTKIPMFVICRGDIPVPGDTPTLLYGYGGFQVVMQPHFSVEFLNWLDAGGVVAVADIRGGGEYGKTWHEAARKQNRQVAFDDFIAAAEWLIDSDITTPERLVIKGESNGGLLVAAVAMQRPDLFKAVYAGAPLLDMIRYHRFGIANLWETEYGTAESPEAFGWLLAYSPYHRILEAEDYPVMLIQGAVNDARVDPMHARKMVARLQQAHPDPAGKAFLLIEDNSGHGGGTDQSTRIRQLSDIWAFLMYHAGLSFNSDPDPGI